MKPQEIMKLIDEMPNGERIELLLLLFDKYFDNRPPTEVIREEKFKAFWGDWDDSTDDY